VKKLMLWVVALAIATGGPLFAQNITGTWQGSLAAQQGRPPLRIVVKTSRGDDEKLKAVMYSIDQGGRAFTASAASMQGSTFKMSVAAIGAEYEGKLGEDGNTITGTWTQGRLRETKKCASGSTLPLSSSLNRGSIASRSAAAATDARVRRTTRRRAAADRVVVVDRRTVGDELLGFDAELWAFDACGAAAARAALPRLIEPTRAQIR